MATTFSAKGDGYREDLRRTLHNVDVDKKWTDYGTVVLLYKELLNKKFTDVMFPGPHIGTDSPPETLANIDCNGFYLWPLELLRVAS